MMASMLAGKLKAVVALGVWMVMTFFSMLFLHRPAIWTFVAGGIVYLAAFVTFFRWLYPGLRRHFTGQAKWEATARLP